MGIMTTRTLTFGSLFAGIGGFDLGFERAGLECKWQVEISDYANRVLAKHWPGVRRHGDIRTFPPEPAADWAVDVICGGFPCQPVAQSGLKLVQSDERWMWPEFARVIRRLSPGIVVIENVPGLLVRGRNSVFQDLAAMGLDAEWGVLSSCLFGAPHTRERLFIIAYPHCKHGQKRFRFFPDGTSKNESRNPRSDSRNRLESFTGIAGIHDGVSNRVDRLKVIGNAVDPRVAEWIGQRISHAHRI